MNGSEVQNDQNLVVYVQRGRKWMFSSYMIVHLFQLKQQEPSSKGAWKWNTMGIIRWISSNRMCICTQTAEILSNCIRWENCKIYFIALGPPQHAAACSKMHGKKKYIRNSKCRDAGAVKLHGGHRNWGTEKNHEQILSKGILPGHKDQDPESQILQLQLNPAARVIYPSNQYVTAPAPPPSSPTVNILLNSLRKQTSTYSGPKNWTFSATQLQTRKPEDHRSLRFHLGAVYMLAFGSECKHTRANFQSRLRRRANKKKERDSPGTGWCRPIASIRIESSSCVPHTSAWTSGRSACLLLVLESEHPRANFRSRLRRRATRQNAEVHFRCGWEGQCRSKRTSSLLLNPSLKSSKIP
jgi:hypothetical protein